MASLNLIVGFDTLIQDVSVGVANYGAIAIVCHHNLSSIVRTYEPTPDGLKAMRADGFTVDDFAYMAVAAIAKQEIKTKTVKIFKRTAANAQTLRLDPANLNLGTMYSFLVNGVRVERANAASETPTTWCTAWQTILTGAGITAVNVTSTNNTTYLVLSLTTSTGRRIYLDEIPQYLTVKDTSVDAGIATSLNAALDADSDFYGVIIDSMSETELNAAAAWCEANKRELHGVTADSETLTNSTTDVASDFVAADYSYSGVMYTSNMSQLWPVALMGRQFGLRPGTNNWENVNLSGIPADNLTSTQIAYAKAKKLGMYLPFKTPVSSTNATHNISAGSGRFFDMTRDRDYFTAKSQASLVAESIRIEKISANQRGMDIYEGALRAELAQAEIDGIIDPGWQLTFPKASEIPNLKATRRFNAQKAFFAYFQGAINGGDITGIFAV